MNQQNCEQEQCVWSTGKEFIESDKGMCLPAVLTASYPDFSGCTKRNTSDKCDGQCQWYDAGFSTCATALGTRPVACPTATWNLETCQYDCDQQDNTCVHPVGADATAPAGMTCGTNESPYFDIA